MLLNITTDNLTGYTLSMEATNPSNTSLVHTNQTDSIPSTTNSTPQELTVNTWGFNLATRDSGTSDIILPTTYKQIPSTQDIIKSTTTPTTDDETILAFGVKADMSNTAGLYSTEFTFTTVANFVPVTIESISPSTGVWEGDTITITGQYLSNIDNIYIGGDVTTGTACTSFTEVSSTEATCTLPNKTAGSTQAVVIETVFGTSNTDKTISYLQAPTVTSISPNTNVWTGTTLTVTGTNFNRLNETTDAVKVGGTACTSYTVTSATSLTCVAPAKTAGSSNAITVANAAGQSNTDKTVTYLAIPTVTNVSPNTNVWTGTTLTVTGTGFINITSVKVGGTECTSKTINSSTSITCIAPAKTAGAQAVTVTNNAGASNGANVTYANPAPSNWTGGDVYVRGSGFASNTTASVGGTACQSTKYISSTLLRCTLPSKSSGSTYTITTSAGTVTGTGTGSNTYNSNSIVYDNATKGDMQSFTSSTCSSLERGQAQVWNDSRNSQKYRVKKMSDGKCWMIDNLRYAYGTLTSSGYLTKDGTNSSTTNSNTNFDIAKYANPGSGTPGTSCPEGTTASTCYGYLYNWYGATAGTGTAGMTSGEATGNICPNSTNWRLPKSNSAGDYAILNTAMDSDDGTSTSWVASTTNSLYAGWQPSGSFQGVFSGFYYSGLDDQGSYAYYWSSTVNSAANAYGLFFYSGYVNPAGGGNKIYGFAVRCLVGS